MRLLLALCFLCPRYISSSPGLLRRKAYYFNTPVAPVADPADDESELLDEIEELEESLGIQDVDDVGQAPNSTSTVVDQIDAYGDNQEMTDDVGNATAMDDTTYDATLESGNATISTFSSTNSTNTIALDATVRSADRSSSNDVVNQSDLGLAGNEEPLDPGTSETISGTGIHPYSPSSLENPETITSGTYPQSSLYGGSTEEESADSVASIEPPVGYGNSTSPSYGSPDIDEDEVFLDSTASLPSVGYENTTLDQAPPGYSSTAEDQDLGSSASASAIEPPAGYGSSTAAQTYPEDVDNSATAATIAPPSGYESSTSEQTPRGYGYPGENEDLNNSASSATMQPPTDQAGVTGPYGSSGATSNEASVGYGSMENPNQDAEFPGDDTDDAEQEEQSDGTADGDLPWKDQDWANKTPKEVADIAEAEALRIMEDKYVPLIVMAMSIVSTAFTLFVAQQMVENPNGIIAKFCRCMVAICRIISYPLRVLLCCCSGSSGRSRRRDRRTHEVLRSRGEFS